CISSNTLTITETNNSNSYCSNMNCSYSIEFDSDCQISLLNLEISTFLRVLSNDTLNLIADGKIIQSFNGASNFTFSAAFPLDVKLEIDFASGDAPAQFYSAPSVIIQMDMYPPDDQEGSSSLMAFSYVLLLFTVLNQI